MSLPTESEVFTKLMEHLRLAQEAAAQLSHLYNAQGSRGTLYAKGWLAVSEQMRRVQQVVTALAMKGFTKQ